MKDVTKNIYKLRTNFIIIGLTGRTGSGCTTVADLLEKGWKDLNAPKPTDKMDINPNDRRKYQIAFDFTGVHWQKFTTIKLSDIIIYFVLLEGYDSFIKNIFSTDKSSDGDDSQKIPETADNISFKEQFDKLSETAKECDTFLKNRPLEKAEIKVGDNHLNQGESFLKFLLIEIHSFRNALSTFIKNNAKNSTEIAILQRIGNNIRQYGKTLVEGNVVEVAPSSLVEKVNLIIKLIKDIHRMKSGDKQALITLDALRNPYEVLYFREKFASFYLMSVNTEEDIRIKNLHKLDYTDTQIKNLDGHEKDGKEIQNFFKQDIDKCIELSDIHLYNDGRPVEQNKRLKKQLVTYLALIMHPGIIPPSPMERIMQIAYTAKLNSGCLSRQVGAAITDENYSLKSIGWNSVPQGQTPCSLRSFDDLCSHCDDDAFSDYERDNQQFRSEVNKYELKYKNARGNDESCLDGLPLSYCFKDMYISLTSEKNQVHTRSLHAEENAFLQLAKYPSGGIRGGKLFATASPCELCSKKAYQLGIKEIYYIDAYPGISREHILGAGTSRPSMILFEGAIGRAYMSLYNPIIPLKDEISYNTGVKIKKEKSVDKKTLTSSNKESNSSVKTSNEVDTNLLKK